MAKASMIWIIGEYAEKIENADELLLSFIESFQEEVLTHSLTHSFTHSLTHLLRQILFNYNY